MRYTPVELRHVQARALLARLHEARDRQAAGGRRRQLRGRLARARRADRQAARGAEDARRGQAARGAAGVDARLGRARSRRGQGGGAARGRPDRCRGPRRGSLGHPRRPGRAGAALRRGAARRDAAACGARDDRGVAGVPGRRTRARRSRRSSTGRGARTRGSSTPSRSRLTSLSPSRRSCLPSPRPTRRTSPCPGAISPGGNLRRVSPSTRVQLRVSPGARQACVVGRHGDAWKVRVAPAPENGKANAAVVALLADTLALPRGGVSIVSGHALAGQDSRAGRHRPRTDRAAARRGERCGKGPE